ncbi:MAG: hypothetical protein IJB00_04985 [Akkermansia sp.]|nr:hypothetical protein [Akkermansia sp.]
MARRSKRRRRRGNSNLPMLLGGIGGVLLVVIVAALALKPAREGGDASRQETFSVADYRRNASLLIGNVYHIEGRVEHIESQGNDRIVAVSVPGNEQERLPLLVRSGTAGKVNLTRGDSFIFEVKCCSGHTDNQREVKGVLLVRGVESK